MENIDLLLLDDKAKKAAEAREIAKKLEKERDELIKDTQRAIWEGGATTGDWLRDVSIYEFGVEYQANHQKLANLLTILRLNKGQYVLIEEVQESAMTEIPSHFIVDAVGRIASEPLRAIRGIALRGPEEGMPKWLPNIQDTFFLGLNFENGQYVKITPPRMFRFGDSGKKTSLEFRTGSEEYVEPMFFRSASEKSYPCYWRMHPSVFSETEINSNPVIECKRESQGEDVAFLSMYIGNEQVMRRMKLAELTEIGQLYGQLVERYKAADAELAARLR